MKCPICDAELEITYKWMPGLFVIEGDGMKVKND